MRARAGPVRRPPPADHRRARGRLPRPAAEPDLVTSAQRPLRGGRERGCRGEHPQLCGRDDRDGAVQRARRADAGGQREEGEGGRGCETGAAAPERRRPASGAGGMSGPTRPPCRSAVSEWDKPDAPGEASSSRWDATRRRLRPPRLVATGGMRLPPPQPAGSGRRRQAQRALPPAAVNPGGTRPQSVWIHPQRQWPALASPQLRPRQSVPRTWRRP